MSKKRDPVIAVLKYFQEADLALATQALSLAQQVVRGRTPGPRLRPAPKKVAGAAPAAGSSTSTSTSSHSNDND